MIGSIGIGIGTSFGGTMVPRPIVWCLGDSLTNGTAYVVGEAPNAIPGIDVGTTDPNAAQSLIYGSYTSRLGRALASKYEILNCGVGGASVFTLAGECAAGYTSINSLPHDGDTAPVGATTYTFRASASAANEVTIGASVTACAVNLANAINAEGTGFGVGTTVNADAFCPNVPGSGLLRIQALLTGPAGNSLTLSTNAPSRISITPFAGGSATSAIYSNAKAALVGRKPRWIVHTLGTNDANRAGYRGRGTATEFARLIAREHADFPDAQIILWRPPQTGSGSIVTAALDGTIRFAVDDTTAANKSFCKSIDGYDLATGADGTHIADAATTIHAQRVADRISGVAFDPYQDFANIIFGDVYEPSRIVQATGVASVRNPFGSIGAQTQSDTTKQPVFDGGGDATNNNQSFINATSGKYLDSAAFLGTSKFASSTFHWFALVKLAGNASTLSFPFSWGDTANHAVQVFGLGNAPTSLKIDYGVAATDRASIAYDSSAWHIVEIAINGNAVSMYIDKVLIGTATFAGLNAAYTGALRLFNWVGGVTSPSGPVAHQFGMQPIQSAAKRDAYYAWARTKYGIGPG